MKNESQMDIKTEKCSMMSPVGNVFILFKP